MIILILFAFLAGVVTVLSPCILPLLPVILSSADSKGKSKPLGIIFGFIASFTFFTLFLSSIVALSGVSADSLRLVSVGILGLFGISLVIPQIQVFFERLFSALASKVPTAQGKSGFFGGVVIGLSLGLLWTPCVGPILASVISLSLTGSVSVQAFLITTAYITGTAIPLFFIMQAGSRALQRVPWLVSNTEKIQKLFGIIMLATAVVVATNSDRAFQAYILELLPNYADILTRIEANPLVTRQLRAL